MKILLGGLLSGSDLGLAHQDHSTAVVWPLVLKLHQQPFECTQPVVAVVHAARVVALHAAVGLGGVERGAGRCSRRTSTSRSTSLGVKRIRTLSGPPKPTTFMTAHPPGHRRGRTRHRTLRALAVRAGRWPGSPVARRSVRRPRARFCRTPSARTSTSCGKSISKRSSGSTGFQPSWSSSRSSASKRCHRRREDELQPILR